MARSRVARGWLARRPPCGKKSQEGQESESFVLRTYIVVGGGEEVTYWLTGKGGASFPGGHDYPNVSMGVY